MILVKQCQHLQKMTDNLKECAEKIGVHISEEKTKIQKSGNSENTIITLNGAQLEVDQFTYLCSNQSSDGDVETGLLNRFGKATAVFRCLLPIWSSWSLGISTYSQYWDYTFQLLCQQPSESMKLGKALGNILAGPYYQLRGPSLCQFTQPPRYHVKIAVNWILRDGRRPCGRPQKS